VWDTTRNVLWFVDIVSPSIHWLDPNTRRSAAYAMPSAVGSLAFAQDGRLIAALRSGIHLFDPSRETLDFLVHPEPDRTTNRLNDGRIGPD
uniref:SMP-30/gluconolactonase/LRE family protein n=2 Tax=Pseudomonadota TaxID=1224 RepID=UPI0013D79C9F